MRPERSDFGESRLRLETIIRLRWVAVIGQTVTVLAVHYGFGYALPLVPCLVVIGLSAFLNIYLHTSYPRHQRLYSRRAALMLGYDLVQLSALLYLTGGLANPFSFLMVVPIAVSASTQPRNITAILVFLALIAVSLLTRLYLPLPMTLELPSLYVYGIWVAIVCCIVFTAIYAYWTAQETRDMSNALVATEMLLAHEQQLAALNGLAAAAAHELGTPLGTIALVAKELEHEVPVDSPIREDILLLRSQAMRCRDILGRLTQKSSEGDNVYSQMSVGHLIEEVIAPHRGLGVQIKAVLKPSQLAGFEHEPVFRRDPSIMYALTNIVENAVDYASSIVEITAEWDGEEIRLTITDDGPGIAPSVMGRLGEPYVTTRARNLELEEEGSGMGLGVFITKTLLERYGATLRLGNRPPPATGAVVEVIWNRARMGASLH